MAMIHCPECNREISDKAPACPHCGYPMASQLMEPAFNDPEIKKSYRDSAIFTTVVCGPSILLFAGMIIGMYWFASLPGVWDDIIGRIIVVSLGVVFALLIGFFLYLIIKSWKKVKR